jgi:predicted short-subunit dehydrogenase-like oxidoreductase (DUF2520 family)
VIVGSGNVAYQLHKAFLQADGISLMQVAARRPEALEDFDARVPKAGLSYPLAEAELYILAVSDQAVGPVSEQLQLEGGLLAHTSGALGLEALSGSRPKGVFYPLQTFSRTRPVRFSDIPLLLEATTTEGLMLLEALGSALGAQTRRADRQARLAAHLAAVFANNFGNHMVYRSQELCRSYGLDPGLLEPLLRETLEKLREMPAFEAQTGPARRRDRVTQEIHRSLLKPGITLELYNLISQSIEKTYENEL